MTIHLGEFGIYIEGETVLYLACTVVAAIAIWRGETMARVPNPDVTDVTKRVDGLYDLILGVVERVCRVEHQLEGIEISEKKEDET